MSEPQMVAMDILTTISPGPGWGTGRSIISTLPLAVFRQASIGANLLVYPNHMSTACNDGQAERPARRVVPRRAAGRYTRGMKGSPGGPGRRWWARVGLAGSASAGAADRMLDRAQSNVFRVLWLFLPEPAIAPNLHFHQLLSSPFLSHPPQQ